MRPARRHRDAAASGSRRPGRTRAAVTDNVVPLFGSRRPIWILPAPPTRPRRYRLRIDLLASQPPIWRLVELDSALTMDVVHEVVQATMGWEDYHLHAFVRDGPEDSSAPRLLTAADIAEGELGTLETDVQLDQVLRTVGDTVGYQYDFGDGWDHLLRLEGISAPEMDGPRARCLAGAGACPPEDVGGIASHNDLAAWLRGEPDGHVDDPERMRAWIPGGYDPDLFDVAAANERVEVSRAGSALTGLHLAPQVTQLQERLGSPRRILVAQLRSARADLPESDPLAALSSRQLADAARPWHVLLQHLPEGGVPLGRSGQLPTPVIAAIHRDLGSGGDPSGSSHRERANAVARLSDDALRLGLVRRIRGQLRVTAAGRAGALDALQLLRHVASRLPSGTAPPQRDAGLLGLVALAAGTNGPDLASGVSDLFAALGWRRRYQHLTPQEVVEQMRPTLEVVARCGGIAGPLRPFELTPTTLGRHLAWSALLAPAKRPRRVPDRRS